MTLLQRLGDGQVLKLMSASRSTPIRWLTADDVQALHVGRYIEELRTVGVQLPADVRIVKSGRRPAVQHLWIPGTPLPDLAAHHPVLFTSAVRQIAAWVAALDSSGARLDTNLANFVINPDDGLVCIDVLPPLLTDLRPPNTTTGSACSADCATTPTSRCARWPATQPARSWPRTVPASPTTSQTLPGSAPATPTRIGCPSTGSTSGRRPRWLRCAARFPRGPR